MTTSTYALPVKTAIVPAPTKHERRRSSMQSPHIRSPSGSLRKGSGGNGSIKPGTAHSVNGQIEHQHARRISASNTTNNVLGIDGVKSWDSKAVAVGPVPLVKGKRHRGQSDMGRRIPLQTTFLNSPGSPRTPLSAKPNTSFDEIFNGILLPLPFLAASLAFPSEHSPFAGPARHPADANVEDTATVMEELHRHQHFVQAGALSAAALLLIGSVARLRLSDTVLDRRKGASGTPTKSNRKSRSVFSAARLFITRTLSLALPFYASVQLGGVRVALVLLVTVASGLSNAGISGRANILSRLAARKEAALLLLALIVVDMVGLLGNYAVIDLTLGYLALLISALAIPPPIPYIDRLLGRHMPIVTSSAPPSAGPTPPTTPRPSGSPRKDTQPSKIADANTSIAAGTALAILTATSSYGLAIPLQLSPIHFSFSVLAMITMTGLSFFALPVTIGSKGKPGLAAGLIVTGLFAFAQYNQIFGTTIIPYIFAIFCLAGYFIALQYSAPELGHFKESRRSKNGETHSMVTAYLLSYCAPGSMLDTILSEKDSRRIAYFACLNLAFMLVQFFYGFVTGSLGLLTDSIHMLFDCLGLAVGLAAAVMSKWPPSLAFPYGYGKVDTLSGFANGIFLILVSIEIILDAMHRLHEGHELRRLNELLTVSVLGFLVNIVGLTVFGHAHHHGHGHDHGHSHGHAHDHSHAHSHANGHADHHHEHKHDHSHDHEHTHSHTHETHGHSKCNGHAKHAETKTSPFPEMPPTPFSMPSVSPLSPNPTSPIKPAHTHSHDNENMQGIFLHIMADALGSVAVIFSTLLTKYDGWSGWDPLASCGIALLIFFSAIPLVKSSGSKLMLGLPNEVEYSCRDALQGLSELRGVIGYSGVRIWMEERSAAGHGHRHHHGHEHAHAHDHHHDDDVAETKMTGVIHVMTAQGADLEDVAERSSLYLKGRGMDLLVHAEVEGSNCWCGSGTRAS